jgi:glycosidase
MQWNESANAGFSKTKPWLPVPASYKTHNVASEQKDGSSVLSFYRQLLALRHKEPALLEGTYIPLNGDDPNVLTYVRRYKDEAILVVLNMSAKDQKVQFDLSPLGFTSPKLSVLLTDSRKPLAGMADGLPMEPYSVFIAKISDAAKAK